MKKIVLQQEPLDITRIYAETGPAEDGAVVLFVGKVRSTSARGATVSRMEYDVYNGMARREMEAIADEAMSRWPVTTCQIHHRFGAVNVGEASVAIAVSSPHREEAFCAARFIIDTIKKKVPLWKKEIYPDGSEWISE